MLKVNCRDLLTSLSFLIVPLLASIMTRISRASKAFDDVKLKVRKLEGKGSFRERDYIT